MVADTRFLTGNDLTEFFSRNTLNKHTSEQPENDPHKRKHRPRRRWRLILKIAFLAFLLFVIITAARILIPALQHRDAVMTLLHYSDNCHVPCFMGITPGETTMEEALEILEEHDWVEKVIRNQFDYFKVYYNRDAPEFLHDQHMMIPVDNFKNHSSQVIHSFKPLVSISDFPFSALILFRGLPDSQNLSQEYYNSLHFGTNVTVYANCFEPHSRRQPTAYTSLTIVFHKHELHSFYALYNLMEFYPSATFLNCMTA